MANEKKYTPGPWKILYNQVPSEMEPMEVPADENCEGWLSKTVCIGAEDHEVFCDVKAYTTSGFLQDFKQWEANVALIAAAPELLEALEKVIEVCFTQKGGNLTLLEEQIRAAITKATKTN